MKSPENEGKSKKPIKNSRVNNETFSSSNPNTSLMPPPFSLTANGVVQKMGLKGDGGDGGKWVDDLEHGGKKRVLPPKPKQKWVKSEESNAWVQEDKGQNEKEALPPIKLPEKYQDEDKKVGWRALSNAHLVDKTKTVTKYFNEDEQKENMLTPDGLGDLLDSNEDLANFARPRMYSMSKAGDIGAFEQKKLPANPAIEGNEEQTTHHSSIFAGDDVMHAGHIGAKNGKINYLDDDSGHYKPDDKHTYAAYKKMKKGNMLDPSGTVKLVNKDADKMDQAEWYNNQVKLPFSAYDQTKGNEKQIRNKISTLTELKEKHSLGDQEDENVVPVPFKPNQVQVSGNPASYGTAQEHNDGAFSDWFEESEESFGTVMLYNPETGGFQEQDPSKSSNPYPYAQQYGSESPYPFADQEEYE